jgi:hypothetical protein
MNDDDKNSPFPPFNVNEYDAWISKSLSGALRSSDAIWPVGTATPPHTLEEWAEWVFLNDAP